MSKYVFFTSERCELSEPWNGHLLVEALYVYPTSRYLIKGLETTLGDLSNWLFAERIADKQLISKKQAMTGNTATFHLYSGVLTSKVKVEVSREYVSADFGRIAFRVHF